MVMDLFFKELDTLYANGDRDGAERFMLDGLAAVTEHIDLYAQLTILNELIGFYRNTGRLKHALDYCEQAKELLSVLESEEFAEYATTLLNIATAYRAAVLPRDAIELYEKAEAVYRGLLPENDLRFAGLYNNMSLAFQALFDWSKAETYLYKALDMLALRRNHQSEAAITHSNLAALFLKQQEYDKAEHHLNLSLSAFDASGGKSPHHPAALAGLAQLYFHKQDYHKAADTYQAALQEIESSFGRNKDYILTARSAAVACRAAGMTELASELEQRAQAAEEALGRE